MLKRTIAFVLLALFILVPAVSIADHAEDITGNVSGLPLSESVSRDDTLSMPQMVSVKNAVGGIDIKWKAVPGAEKYRVLRKLDDGRWCTLLDTESTECKDKWAKSGNTYSYSVRCISSDGTTFMSDYDPVGKQVFYLASPKLKEATWGNGSIVFSWEAVTGAENYRVYRKTGKGSWTAIGDITAIEYEDVTIVPGTQYAYTVKCISADGRTAISACDSTGKSLIYADKPTIKSVKNLIAGVSISWNAVSGAEKYRVLRKTGNGRWCTLLDTTELSCVDKWAKSGVDYSYTVRCITADGTQFTSAFDSVGKQITRIAAPKIKSITNVVGGVTIAWDAVPGVSQYRVLRKTENGTWGTLLTTSETSCKDKWAKSGTKYIYTVRGLAEDGTTFIGSYYEAGKTITYVAAPTISTLDYAPGGVSVTWKAVTGAAKYRVFRKTASGSWTKLGDTKNAFYVDRTGSEGTKYFYTVRCLDANGTSISGCNSTGKSIVWKNLSLFANTESVQLMKGDSYVPVTITFTQSGSLTAKVEDSGIASYVWGNWEGDTITLRIYPQKCGTTNIIISNTYDSQKLKIKVEVLPDIDINVQHWGRLNEIHYSYDGSINNSQGIDLNNCEFTFDERYDGTYWVKMTYDGYKAYDDSNYYSRPFHMFYKIYNSNGTVVDSGVITTDSISVGDHFVGTYTIGSLAPGYYRMVIEGKTY